MRLVTARRTSQVFFFVLFLWFCLAATPGEEWYRLRGWPVNWFVQLDPLAAVATVLATGVLYAGLAWALLTLVATLVFGRFFCGWVCPFGTLHHAVGHLGMRGRGVRENAARNRPSAWQGAKYAVLAFFLGAAASGLLARPLDGLVHLAAGIFVLAALLLALPAARGRRRIAWPWVLVFFAGLWAAFLWGRPDAGGGLLSGFLDPVVLVTRSVNLVLLPLADAGRGWLWAEPRFFVGAFSIFALFAAALLANLWQPRFYCRYVCPLGALLGLVGGRSLFRIGKEHASCRACQVCDAACHGACEPSGEVRVPECVLCMNCLEGCADGEITYGAHAPAVDQRTEPEMGRRGFLSAAALGALSVPAARLSGATGKRLSENLVRPPGALAEPDFLARCVRCGQCMRVCPTGVIHPAGIAEGIEAYWTPVLDFRAAVSGCRHNCVFCGHVCPTAAIRPLSMDERMGLGPYADAGPVRCGTAFVNRGRCLPWAMGRPCIVCQENCPVSPKAIVTDTAYQPLPDGERDAVLEGPDAVRLAAPAGPGAALWAGGDVFLRPVDSPAPRRRVTGVDGRLVLLAPEPAWPGDLVFSRAVAEIRLARPVVVPERCIGCGVCESVCPVHSRRAITVSPENATRMPGARLLAGGGGRDT